MGKFLILLSNIFLIFSAFSCVYLAYLPNRVMKKNGIRVASPIYALTGFCLIIYLGLLACKSYKLIFPLLVIFAFLSFLFVLLSTMHQLNINYRNFTSRLGNFEENVAVIKKTAYYTYFGIGVFLTVTVSLALNLYVYWPR